MPKIRTITGHDKARYVAFRCPGCGDKHVIPVQGEGIPLWQWNGDEQAPTLAPSILARGTYKMTDEEYERVMRGEDVQPRSYVCHSFVRSGRIEFLGDCTHALAGQTVELAEAFD